MNKVLDSTNERSRIYFFLRLFIRRLESSQTRTNAFYPFAARRLSAAAEARRLSSSLSPGEWCRLLLHADSTSGKYSPLSVGGRTNSPTAAGENLEPSMVFAAYTLRQSRKTLEVGLFTTWPGFGDLYWHQKHVGNINKTHSESVPDTGRSRRENTGAAAKLLKRLSCTT